MWTDKKNFVLRARCGNYFSEIEKFKKLMNEKKIDDLNIFINLYKSLRVSDRPKFWVSI